MPRVVPLDGPQTVFSAERALKHLRVIAAAPHPAGSPANRAAKEYIVRELQKQGLPVQVQDVVSSRSYLPGVIFGARVANVVTRFGPGSSNAALFVCHYDSVPHGYGAADNGAACAAFLEAIRALRAAHTDVKQSGMKNDLIFLFSDGEETGLAGAHAFADSHPWMKDVRVVVDLEGRGDTGPSALFETGAGSGGFVRAYAGAVQVRRGNSLSAAVYNLLPNDTDFTVYQRARLPGLNFAIFQGVPYYHTPLDNVQLINVGSVQHHGENVMGTASVLSRLDLKQTTGDDAGVYFDLGGRAFVQYSFRTAWILGGLAMLAFAAFVMRQIRDTSLNAKGVAMGLLWSVCVVVAGGLTAYVFLKLMSLRSDGADHFMFGEPYNGVHYRVVLMTLPGLILWAGLLLGERLRLDYTAMAGGALLFAGLLLLASLIWLPGASFLLQWPFIFGTLAYGAVFASRGTGRAVLVLAASVPILFLGADNFPDFFHALTVKMGAALVVPVSLYWLCLIPLVELIRRSTGVLLRNTLIGVAFAGLVNLFLSGGYDALRPRQDAVMYFHNSGTGESHYATCDVDTDSWTKSIFPAQALRSVPRDFFPIINSCVLGSHGFLMTPAPVVPPGSADRSLLTPPVALNLARVQRPGGDVLSFTVRPNPEAAVTMMFVKGSHRNKPVWINGRRIEQVQVSELKKAHELIVRVLNLDDWAMVRQSAPDRAIQIEWSLKGGPVELILVDVIYRMPRFPGAPVRPALTIPAPAFFPSDSTYVSKSYRL
ncbi:MAG: M28 family peptidase [Spirochaetia bacterium]|nr:M28 family peptidase [Spirochaetia bacterium]